MTNVIITGASGFIGSHIVRKFLEMDYRVIVPVRQQSIFRVDNLKKYKNFKVIPGDFFDPSVLNQITDEIDSVIHFASIRGEGAANEKAYQKINIEGTQHLLEFAKRLRIPRFIYCSSVGVFGTIPASQPAAASDDVNPDNLYHDSKWQSEQLVNSYHCEELNTCVLRPTITYGSGDDGFIPKLVDLIKTKRFPLSLKKVYIHILDVDAFAELVLRIVKSADIKGKTYIIADKSPVLLKELVELVTKHLGDEAGYLKIPAFILNSGEAFLKIFNQKKLLTSVQLINHSWTYNIDETIKDLGYKASDTFTVLSRYLKEIKSN